MALDRPFRAVTIDDVAERAGVSAKTVSRVLNNEPNVRPSKREIVLQATRELGYKPNPAARSLAGARSFLIAHLHDNAVPEYVAAANDGIYSACRSLGFFLLPERVEPDASDRLERLETFLRTARPDAVVLTPPLCDDLATIEVLERMGVRYASVSARRGKNGGAVFRHDERQAAHDMVDHLISLGHNKIAMIAGPSGHKAASARSDGYQEAMLAAGLRIDNSMMELGDYTMRSGLEAAQRLISHEHRPTAIFAANDDMAVGALTAALASGLSIPDDISIAGYDDTRLASAVWPPLTTIRQPVREMAQRAAEHLMRSENSELDDEVLAFELIVRASTGSPPH
ncbi:MAG: LacI family DNA-binding transcriptional regulator [Pseudomonadota bacterium]